MKTYILEDEINILKYILSLVNEISYLQVVGYATDIRKAEAEIPLLQPELILADIQLKDDNSFNLFNKIQTEAHIVFITAYHQYAIDALNLGAFAYLLKPVDTVLFNETMERCYKKDASHKLDKQQVQLAAGYYNKQEKPCRIALRSSDVVEIVDIADILYCRSDKGYTTFFMTGNRKIIVSKVLKEYDGLLPEESFIRCHQSYLVNIQYIRRFYKEGQIELHTGERIPVSDRKKGMVINFIEKLL